LVDKEDCMTQDDSGPVKLAVDGRTAVVTLNRPSTLNAFDQRTIEALLASLLEVVTDASIRAVVLDGSGRAFCAGGDLRAVLEASPDRPGSALHRLAGVLHRCVVEIRTMDKPVVAAISGPAAGAGLSLALACDLRVMGESAFLQQAYTSNGLAIDGGGTHTLPRMVGLARALEIAMLDERIDSTRALELGLVTRVVADDRVLPEARALATRVADNAIGTLGRVKRLMNRSFDQALEAQLEDERRAIADSANTPEGLEGLRAFVGKRKPAFGAV
jgi:2-(1,2-epoxy-1,2-dihydrophenyl)acetyl-CoA isomerase